MVIELDKEEENHGISIPAFGLGLKKNTINLIKDSFDLRTGYIPNVCHKRNQWASLTIVGNQRRRWMARKDYVILGFDLLRFV
jgi:hypothetical protein